ncbi:EPIDERMAL PATTERNING FACTOR-like protein 4 [Canna indica]|uniref:Epidermal patterning factor-like protein n=1 Tax=Canna indica TaxID=4628 RepID=A0AAQ3QTA6_9LILI|nr:EPIDERMAL PATTERNING FACTOR-like protein 4 [Canna indica]
MGVLRHRRPLSAALVFVFIIAATLGNALVGIAGETGDTKFGALGTELHWERVVVTTRRRLGGPGSSPPACRARCGRCYPCLPVHVSVHPGESAPLEYYPEAWRCKCGDKLFKP